MIESDFQALLPTNNTKPKTLASAATIAPTTFLTILTGNVEVTTITPPITQQHTLAIQFAGVAGVGVGGNILSAKASVADQVMLLVYNPNTAQYVPVG